MARSPRWEMHDGLHHVTARAPKGLVLFRTAGDGTLYLDLLAAVVRARAWSLRTFCLMNNHVHLLVSTPEPDLHFGMKTIHERFASRMHQRYDGHGHVFGARFKNKPVLTAEHEIACLRYIARNPVAAGLCRAPQDYRWSAHRSLAGLEPVPNYLDVAAARRALELRTYLELTETADLDLLERLATEAPRTWLVDAVDHHKIPIDTIARHLGVHRATAYKRLAVARDSGV